MFIYTRVAKMLTGFATQWGRMSSMHPIVCFPKAPEPAILKCFASWELMHMDVLPTCIPLSASEKYSGKESQEQAAIGVKAICAW